VKLFGEQRTELQRSFPAQADSLRSPVCFAQDDIVFLLTAEISERPPQLFCELAAMAAVEIVDQQADYEPPDKASPGDNG
jgi:hypothetical protein